MTEVQPLQIGKSEVRGDALAKAAGTEPFAADYFPDNLIWAGAVRAGVASGRLMTVDEENLAAGYRRHSCMLHYRLGAMRDGTLRALHCQLVYDTGAYAHLGGEVMELGMEHAGGCNPAP